MLRLGGCLLPPPYQNIWLPAWRRIGKKTDLKTYSCSFAVFKSYLFVTTEPWSLRRTGFAVNQPFYRPSCSVTRAYHPKVLYVFTCCSALPDTAEHTALAFWRDITHQYFWCWNLCSKGASSAKLSAKTNGQSWNFQKWQPHRLDYDCLSQLCPTQTAYWAKYYVTVLARAAHFMTYYWGPHIEWLTLILAN